MELTEKITAFCVVAALLSLVIKKATPEIAMVLCIAAAAAVLLALYDAARELKAVLALLRRSSTLGEEWFIPLYKTVGIAVVVRLGSDLCRDVGERALAGVVEMAGAVCALLAAAPLMETVFSLILELMK